MASRTYKTMHNMKKAVLLAAQYFFFIKSTSEIYVNFERVTFPGKQRYSRFDRFVIL